MTIYPSVAGRIVPALLALTRADILSLLRRIRRDSLRRYNVAFVLAWLGTLAGIALASVAISLGIQFVARGVSATPWPLANAIVVGGCAPLLANVFYSALLTLLLKREIVASLPRAPGSPG
ncbi:TPA: hypothetical protein ACK3Q6_003009 [Burkholderia cepacia]|uniref:Uncharacterized protein n=1 Tax=Burkholderia cepacia TaxID=292 RepID=A0AAQ0FBT3_BURCE|nr:hypothetical protein [Burkholderia cepacia]HDR9762212.1 hypothetical protein [Burkholderia cepacia ATCC 25416]MCA8363448.1 hypothetical protein [Burkholderia cepacia]NTX48022.1 hypothetical protein [Burkholderia cepacia]QFS38357.1 hypothetical protein BURCE16_16530 [Burkholderia cepacia]RAQ03486.1 hypothetical protein DPR02_28915 [Burkholderia cepacia]